MRMRRLIGLTIIGAMALGMNLQAATIGSLTNDMEITISEDKMITKQKGDAIQIINQLDDSYMIQVDGGLAYEVAKENIKLEGVLTETSHVGTKLRVGANENAEIISTLDASVPVFVEGRVDNWYLVKVNDMTGYIYKSQLDESKLDIIPDIKTEQVAPSVKKEKGEEVVEYAKQFLGNPYVYGGNSLTKGVDCSGFTSQVYKHFGVKLQRSSRAQYTSNGYKVSKNEIKAGDLVFYGNNGVINHVAIYAGNGQIIHANDAKTGIKMSKLEYGKPIIGIKRVI